MSPLITVFVVLQVVVRPGPSELCKVLLVVELQEVGPFSAEPQKGGRQAARQGHERLGAGNTMTHKFILTQVSLFQSHGWVLFKLSSASGFIPEPRSQLEGAETVSHREACMGPVKFHHGHF